jgi:hypothetical protein
MSLTSDTAKTGRPSKSSPFNRFTFLQIIVMNKMMPGSKGGEYKTMKILVLRSARNKITVTRKISECNFFQLTGRICF